MKKTLFLVAFIFSISLVSNAQWIKTKGPHGGTITATSIKDNLFLVATNSGVFRSDDGGVSWTIADASIQDGKNFVYLNNKIFLQTPWYIYRSVDQGKNWTKIYTYSGFGDDLRTLVVLGSRLLMGSYTTIYISDDEGITWNRSSTGLGGSALVSKLHVDNNKVFAFVYNVGLYCSSDSGAIWNYVGQTPQDSYICDMVAANNNMLATSAGFDAGVLQSRDGGNTWSYTVQLEEAYSVCRVGDTILAGTSKGLFMTQDWGDNWTDVSITPGLSHHWFSVDKNNMLCPNDRGLYLSGIKPLNWSLIPEVFSSQVFALHGGSNNLLAGTYQRISYTANGGDTWSDASTNIPDAYTFVNTFHRFNGKLFACTQIDGVYKSSDDGATWTPANNGLNLTGSISGMASKGSTLFLAVNSNGVYRSQDDGNTWQQCSNGLTSLSVMSIMVKDTVIIAGMNPFGTGPSVYISRDNGDSWQQAGIGITAGTYLSDMADAPASNRIYAVGENSTLFYSANHGLNWSKILNVPGSYALTSISTIGTNIFLGTTGGMLLSTNNGLSWTTVNTGFQVNPYVMATEIWRDTLYIGTNGQGVWKRPLSDFGIATEVNTVAKNNRKLSVYPNPSKNEINFSGLPLTGTTAHVRILDMQGRIVYEKDLEAGSRKISIDLPGGIYVLTCRNAGEIFTEKLVVQKD